MSRVWTVPGISCDHCRRAIEDEVGEVPGVASVSVDVASKRVSVEGDAPDEAVLAAIAEAGYEVAAGA